MFIVQSGIILCVCVCVLLLKSFLRRFGRHRKCPKINTGNGKELEAAKTSRRNGENCNLKAEKLNIKTSFEKEETNFE